MDFPKEKPRELTRYQILDPDDNYDAEQRAREARQCDVEAEQRAFEARLVVKEVERLAFERRKKMMAIFECNPGISDGALQAHIHSHVLQLYQQRTLNYQCESMQNVFFQTEEIREMEQLFKDKFGRSIPWHRDEEVEIEAAANEIRCRLKKLSQKFNSDPEVAEAVEFVENMTSEVIAQNERLKKSRDKVTAMKSSTHTRKAKPRTSCYSDLSAQRSTPLSHLPQAGMVEDEDKETYGRPRNQQERALLKNLSQPDGKWKDVDQSALEITTFQEFTSSMASHRGVCFDVKNYIQRVDELVQKRIKDLPERVRRKLDSVMIHFKRLIAGMWKLLLYDLLLSELTNLFAFSKSENTTISRKKGRLKYGFQMASMTVLCLANDVESNPGPLFHIRSCIENLTRRLSKVLRYNLPVEGSLWSDSVAEAAYAAGYSPKCKWSNPSGKGKDKLTTLIERATELGKVLTTLDCLPAEFAPFVNDLGNYEVQEQLVIYYQLKNFRSAVNTVGRISSLGDEHKQIIMQEIQTLNQICGLQQMDSGRMFITTGFEQLADSTTSHPNVSCQKKTTSRKSKQGRHRNKQGNQFDNLDKSQNSAVQEPEAAFTLGEQMDPDSGNNETSIALNLNEALPIVSKFREVTIQEDLATKSLAARMTDRTSPADENQTFSVDTKESESFGSNGEAITFRNQILDSNANINQSHDIEVIDISGWQIGPETQNVMDDDARITVMTTTSTNSPGMTQLQKKNANLNDQLTNPPAQSPVVPLLTESDRICQTHDAHTNKQMESANESVENPLKYDNDIMQLRNLFPGQNESTNSYPDTDRDEMYGEETVDGKTSKTRDNEAEDLTLGTEHFAITEPVDTGKQRILPTIAEYLSEFKASILEEVDARFDFLMALQGYNIPNEHVGQNENGEPMNIASSNAEHTEPIVQSSDSPRKRNLTDPENGPTSKKRRQ